MDTGWLNGTAALIAALGTLLGGMGALWPQLKAGKRDRTKAVLGIRHKMSIFAGILLLAFSGIVFAVRWFNERNLPLNERLTTKAWDALSRNDYATAFSTADDCIANFKALGGRQEKDVSNDLAVCFLIKGEAADKLGRRSDAINAYTNTTRYKYARIFDPSGRFFWSPAEVASDRLAASSPSIEITYPQDQQRIDGRIEVHGKMQNMPTDQKVWVFVKSADSDYYLYPTSSSDPSGSDWQSNVCVGKEDTAETEFTIFACPAEPQAQGIFLEDRRPPCEKRISQLPSTVRLADCSKKTVYVKPAPHLPQFTK